MNKLKQLSLSVFFIFSSSAFAVTTTSDIKGSLVDENGKALSGVEVTVTYEATDTVKLVTTDENGNFYAANLKAGGPYTIASGRSKVSDVFLSIGKTSNIRLTLSSSSSVEDVVVTASRLNVVDTTSGPSYVFSSADLANAAAYDRDIKEVLAQHPSIYINEADNKAMQCAGNNSRLNGLTVDGIALNDSFGLNSNGYPAERMPFSYDAIDQVAVEFAPYDVQYGGFSACVVNAVTKSGTSELKGSFFYEMTNDDLTGDEADGKSILIPAYDEVKYGFTVGGPILKDSLLTGDMYFFASYEQYDDQDLGEFGYAGSGMPSELDWLSKAQYDQIVSISKDKYNFDPGGLPSALDSESEKLLVKVDYYINDNTRAVFTYNSSEGFTNQPSDASPTEFEFSNHFYKRGNDLEAYMLKVFSSIGDVNTQFKYGYTELQNMQVGLGGSFGDFQIDVDGGKVYLGGTDDSRQNNLMNYDTTTMAFIGDYQMGNQLITFGYDFSETTIFNMFMQESIGGEWDFTSVANFDAGNVKFDFQNTTSLNPRDASKEWAYDVSTLFIQSEMSLSDDLDVSYGIRYEKYGVEEAPAANAGFASTYGYTNALTFDGAEVLMPRISFSYRADDVTEYYGGFGVFSGGNPAVWFSNNYSNNGVTIIDGDGNYNAFTDTMCDPLTGSPSTAGPGYAVPCGAIAEVTGGTGGGDTNSLDPDFDMPTFKKLSFGMKKQMGEYDVTVDWMYTRNKNPFYVYNLANNIGGFTATGHAISDSSGCCTGDYSLANSGATPKTVVFSINANRSIELAGHDMDLTLGYTNTDAQDVHPMASSVAYTNANENLVSLNPNDPSPARSNWEIEHRFVSTLNFMLTDNTNVSLFYQLASGNPYSLSSYGYSVDYACQLNMQPCWRASPGEFPSIPIVINDNTNFEDSAVQMRNLDEGVYERNVFTTDWSSRLDLKLTHTPMDNLDLYMVVKNLGNLINGNNGAYYRSSSANGIATAKFVQGGISYADYNAPNVNQVIGTSSIWNIKLGFKYSY
jgi:outer membrane receptor for ferrienterochelin and colicin